MVKKTAGRRALAVIAMALLTLSFGLANGYGLTTPVDLGTAGNFAILSKAGISTTGTTTINGDIGISPAAASFITGFGALPFGDSTNTFSTSPLVAGKIYAANYTAPTPANLTAAVSAMEAAYTNAAGRTPPDSTELGAGNISGMTLGPGIYKWATGVIINVHDSLILSGGASDVWIFQIGTTLDVGSYAYIALRGGAQPQNIFWQVATQTTLGTYTNFVGTILDATTIVIMTGATLNGRALSQTAVTLDAVTMPMAIELLEFACHGGSGRVTVTWRTASENNEYQWLIERSVRPGGDFHGIAVITAGTGSPNGRNYSYTDAAVLPNTTYYYRLGDTALDGLITWYGPLMVASGGQAGDKMQLLPCRPNPASGTVDIRYLLPRSGNVSLDAYDLCGRRVITLKLGQKQSGAYNLAMRCKDSQGGLLPAGVYFYRLTFEGESVTQRLVLLR